jgi:integrase
VNVYLIPLLGETPITEITDDELEQYVHNRINFYIDGPGSTKEFIVYERAGKTLRRPIRRSKPTFSTLNKERVAFNQIMHHARKVMRVRIDSRPSMKIDRSELSPSQVRPDFTMEEWHLLQATIEDSWYEQNASRGSQRYRYLLKYFCDFLFASGLRVSEAKNLNWGHISEIGRETIALEEIEKLPEDLQEVVVDHYISTGELSPTEIRIRIPPNLPGLKTRNHARTVIPLLDMNNIIEDLYDLYTDSGIEIVKESPLWMHPDGTRVQRFDHSFDRALKKCDLLYRDGQKRSLTSIRHTYATQRIYAGATKNGLAFLCANMGTTPEMIHKHYNHALVEVESHALQQTKENAQTLKRLLSQQGY